jgi:hypothetical protein
VLLALENTVLSSVPYTLAAPTSLCAINSSKFSNVATTMDQKQFDAGIHPAYVEVSS